MSDSRHRADAEGSSPVNRNSLPTTGAKIVFVSSGLALAERKICDLVRTRSLLCVVKLPAASRMLCAS